MALELPGIVASLELFVSLIAAWPLARQLSFAPFWHRSRCKAMQRAGLLAVYVVFLGALAVLAPVVLHIVAVAAAGFLLFERWRARPSYGRARGLPPGSLGLVPRGHERNAAFFETLIARHGPIFKLSRDFRPYVYIYGHERGMRFLREHDEGLVGSAQAISAAIPKGFIRYMPASIHTGYRRILQSGITGETIDATRPFITAGLRSALVRIAADCKRSSIGAVDADDYLRDCVFEIVQKMFFGVQTQTALFDQVFGLYADIDTRTDNCGAGARRSQAMAKMSLLLRDRVRDASETSGAVPPCCLKSMVERNEATAIDDTVTGNWAGMVEFATIDIVGLLRWLLKMMIDHPAWLERVRSEQADRPAMREDQSAAARIVKETLRLERSEFLTRKATRDIRFDGYLIPQGWTIRIGIREGNRNPEIFERAGEFDPDRFLDREYSLVEYAPFGLYRHNCLGAEFASVVAGTFITELAEGFDLQGTGTWTTEYAPPHWRPRTGYAIGLKARPD